MSADIDFKELKAGVRSALQSGDWAGGAGLMKEWCRQRPRDSKAWYYAAYFNMKMGRLSEAEVQAEKALHHDPDNPEAIKLLDFIHKQITLRRKKLSAESDRLWPRGTLVEGRYEVRGSKRGGMGEVYFAFDRELDHMVAVKAPLLSILEDPGKKSRFYREAEAWMGLGMHPNICSAYYLQEISGIPWLFIEYIGGGTLETWIENRDLSFRERLDIAIQIASGMNHTHTFAWRDDFGVKHQGLVHRDLKPANILLNRLGGAKVTDFGLVGLATGDGTSEDAEDLKDLLQKEKSKESDDVDWEISSDVRWETITVAGRALGTPPYMAPEQWRSAHVAGFSADIYAFGCILYDLFCGRRPFVLDEKHKDAMPIHRMYMWEKMHSQEPPPDPRSLAPGLPPPLADLMLHCLAKAPNERPESFESVRRRLKSIFEGHESESYPRPEPRPTRLLADSLNNQGASFLTIGQTGRAENALKEALTVDPHHIEATFNLAMHQWRKNDITHEEVYRRMEDVGRSHTARWRHKQLLGKMYLYFGDYPKAAANLRQAAKTGGTNVRVFKDLGLALSAELGAGTDPASWREVEDCFRRVMEQGYEDPVVITGRSLAILRLGRMDEAHAFYTRGIGPYPDEPFSLEHAIHRYLPGQEVIATILHNGWVNCLDFSRDGRNIFCGGENRISSWTIRKATITVETADPTLPDSVAPKEAADPWDVYPETRFRETLLKLSDITAIGIHPLGNTVLLGGPDGGVRQWDMAKQTVVRTLQGHTAEVRAIAFSPDGQYAVTSGADTELRLWELEGGRQLERFIGHEAPITAVRFSPDAQLVLSGSTDRTLRLWNSYDGIGLYVFQGHEDRITDVVISRDGRFAASASWDRTVRIWDLKDKTCRRTIDGHEGRVLAAVFSSDGRKVISGAQDRMIRVWDVESGRLDKAIRLDNRPEMLAISPNSQLLAYSQANAVPPNTKLLGIMDFRSRERYRLSPLVTIPISLSKADKRESEFQSNLLEARKHLERENFQETAQFIIRARSTAGYERDDEALDIWSALVNRFPYLGLRTAWEAAAFVGHTEPVTGADSTPDGGRIVSAGADHTLRIWDVESERCLQALEGHTDRVNAVKVHGNGSLAVSVSDDKTLRLWDLETGTCLRSLLEHTDGVTAVAISPDERYALTGGRDHTVGIWELRSRMRIKTLTAHTDEVTAVAFSPDGLWALSGSRDRTVRVWDLGKGQCERVLTGHKKPVTAVLFSPDGRYFLSACEDQLVRKWEFEKDELPEVLGGHSDAVTSLAFSPDSRYLATGSRDRTIRLWDLLEHKCISTFEGHGAAITSLTLSRDRQRLVSTGEDNTVRLWKLDWEPDVRETAPWDEGARPYLDIFLTLRTPYAAGGLARRGRPQWDAEDFQALLTDLAHRGFGWLTPRGVRKELKRMTRDRKRWFSFSEVLEEAPDAIRGLFAPLGVLRLPLLILYKLLPATLMGVLMLQNDFFDLHPAAAALIEIFLLLIMFLKKR